MSDKQTQTQQARIIMTPEAAEALRLPLEPLRFDDFDAMSIFELREAGQLIIDELHQVAAAARPEHNSTVQTSMIVYFELLEQQCKALLVALAMRLEAGNTRPPFDGFNA